MGNRIEADLSNRVCYSCVDFRGEVKQVQDISTGHEAPKYIVRRFAKCRRRKDLIYFKKSCKFYKLNPNWNGQVKIEREAGSAI